MTTPPTQAYSPPRRDFIGKPAPPGYIAGIGRGATGFTTRSDIGPAREAAFARPDEAGPSGLKPKGQQQALKRSANDDEEEEVDLNESNYDEFAGYGGSLFSRDPYEEDDEEADKIYAEIDKHIDERGKALRESRARQELGEYRQKRPKIQQQFLDLKANLKQVSEEEWASIPDVGDARNRKQRVARQDKFTPVPDSLLAHQAKLASGGEKLVYIDPSAMNQDDSDEESDGGRDNAQSDQLTDRKPILPLDDNQALTIGEMSEFRSSYMSMKLSRAANSTNADTTNQTTAINAQDFLSKLQSMGPNQITDAATVNDYRKKFTALRSSDPAKDYLRHLALVRLEESAGNLKTARKLIMERCKKEPKNSFYWLEAARLHPPDIAKGLMAEAVRQNPRSVDLWIKAAELENTDEDKRSVYAKARSRVPRSVKIWKQSIALEQPEQARELLRQAVEWCPKAVEFWVALSRLLPYEEASQVLKEANEKNPEDRGVWITAAKLQEQVGELKQIGKIIELSVSDLAARGVVIVRDEWLREAIDADRAGFKHTCRQIIKRIIGWNIAEKDRLNQWLEDAQSFIDKGSIDCARAVFMAIIEQEANLIANDKLSSSASRSQQQSQSKEANYCKLESVWLAYANFELKHGTKDSLLDCLRQAVQANNCAKSETLWLMLANQTRDNLVECRRTLAQALNANPDSEKIVVAAVELESENGNSKVARRILADACMSAKTPQLVMRSAKLEWSLGNLDEAQRMLQAGVQEYKNHTEFYLSLGQIDEQRNEIEKAKGWYSSGLKFNPTCVELWISMAKLEERTGNIAKARSRLEMARLRNSKNVKLWLESAQLEWRQYLAKANVAGSQRSRPDTVTTILAKGIRDCKDKPEVERLNEMQVEISKRKFG